MSHRFEILLEHADVLGALEPAFDEAQRVATESDYNQKGAVFCQVQRRLDGDGVRITGAFVPPAFAERINAILTEYKTEQLSAANEGASK